MHICDMPTSALTLRSARAGARPFQLSRSQPRPHGGFQGAEHRSLMSYYGSVAVRQLPAVRTHNRSFLVCLRLLYSGRSFI